MLATITLKFPWSLQPRPVWGAEAQAWWRPPPLPAGLGLRSPHGVCYFLAAWPLAGTLPLQRPPPSQLPSGSHPRLRPQGSAEGPQAECSEVFIGISIKMRTTGVLRAFRSWPSRQAGSRVSRGIWSPRTVASVFGLVVPLWPVSSRTSCGAFVACRWLRWRGHHFPTAVATLTELRVCRRQVGRNVLRPLQGSGEMLLKRQ